VEKYYFLSAGGSQPTEDRGDAIKSVDCLVETVLMSACLSCLGSIVNNVTRNFTLIGDCLKKWFGHLISFEIVKEKDVQCSAVQFMQCPILAGPGSGTRPDC
jgi:hypothetical protein